MIAFFKLITVIANLLMVSVLIKELNIHSYGYYILLVSIINWVYFFDIGINKGLKNIITINFEKNKFKNLQYILNTTLSSSIAFYIIMVITIVIFYQNIFDYLEDRTKIDKHQLFMTSIIFLVIIGVKFIGNTFNQIAISIHKSHIVSLATAALTVLTLISILITVFLFKKEISVFIVLLFELVLSLFTTLFVLRYIILKLNVSLGLFKFFKFKIIKDVLKESFILFVIQICNLLLISSDRFLIMSLVDGVENITKYDIGYKVFGLILIPFYVVSTPLWASFASAKFNYDYSWLKKTFSKLKLYIIISLISILIIHYLFDFIIYYWVGDAVQIENKIKLSFGALFFFYLISGINHDFLMGNNKYQIYMIMLIFAVLAKILFLIASYFYFEIMTSTIINSSLMGYLILAIISTYSTVKILQNNKR